MKPSVSRRAFLGNLALATSGITLLSASSITNALTLEDQSLIGYNPYASTNADMRQTLLGKHISVSGKVFNKDGSGVVPNATIEVWHLSPNSEKYRHRAKLTSDANGNYTFITDVPNRSKGNMPCIHFKISSGESSYVSRLWMNEQSAFIHSDHWAINQHLGESLLPRKESGLLHDEIKFNFSI